MITDLTTKEAAAHFRRSVFTIRRMIDAGLLTARKIGRDYLIDRESLLAFEKRQTRSARKA